MKEFFIDRSRWQRGVPHASSLLTRDGCQCCIGFYLSSVGVNQKMLLNRIDPTDVVRHLPPEAAWLLETLSPCIEPRLSEHARTLLAWNDTGALSASSLLEGDEDLREAAIATIFMEKGVKVTFVDTL